MKALQHTDKIADHGRQIALYLAGQDHARGVHQIGRRVERRLNGGGNVDALRWLPARRVPTGSKLQRLVYQFCQLAHFNLLNRTNFDVPNRVAFTPNFGRIFSAKPARQMQFGAKILF